MIPPRQRHAARHAGAAEATGRRLRALRATPTGVRGRASIGMAASAAAVLLGGVVAPLQAATPVIACVDPKTTTLLSDPEMLARHDLAWRVLVEKRGRCYRIEPSERWEPVYSAGGLVVMRKTPPHPGIPPLYFRADAAPLPADASSADPSRSLSAPARRLVQGIAAPVGEVRMETLPPLAGPAAAPLQTIVVVAPQVAGPAVTPQAAGLLGSPASPDVGSPAPQASAGAAPVVLPELAPASPAVDTPAADRGYALGFAIAIVLIVLLLAGLALLLRIMLRPPPEVVPARVRPSQPGPSLLRPKLAVADPEPAPDASAPDASAPDAWALDGSAPDGTAFGGSAPPEIRPDSPRQAPSFVYAECQAPALPGLAATYAETLLAAQPEAGPSPDPAATGSKAPEFEPATPQNSAHAACAFLLRQAGWEAEIVRAPGSHQANVVAHRGGRIMALRCLPDQVEVDEEAIEEACLARERERADLGVIVCNGPRTVAARTLAARTGIDLLQEEDLADFVGQKRPVT